MSASSTVAPAVARLRPVRIAAWSALTLAIAGVALALAHRGGAAHEDALPVLGTVPDFRFTDQAGHPFDAHALDGHVSVVNFIFTRCKIICPRVTQTVATLQPRARAAAPGLRFVSISIDPANDTPDALAAFAATHHADLASWSFLTGDESAVRDTVLSGFKISLSRDPALPATDPDAITHGTHLVLVDGARRIRGYYDSADPERLDALVHDAARLAAEGPGADPS